MLTKSNVTEVNQEIGPGCRCGCIVHLGSSKPKRIIAGETQSCPGRSFWLIQVDGENTISMQLSFLRLPCGTQYIKVRDGPSLSSTLLVELNGDNGSIGAGIRRTNAEESSPIGVPLTVESTGAQLLVEFFSGEIQAGNTTSSAGYDADAAACTGGFVANVKQLGPRGMSNSSTILAATRLSVKSRTSLQKKTLSKVRFTLVHLSAMIFATIIILISALLGAQYMVRYRMYHLAVARRQDEGSHLHTPRASLSSLHGPPSRAISTTTLLSEVIYLVKMRPKRQLRHSILRESADVENVTNETEFKDADSREQMVKGEDATGFGSTVSMMTLRNEHASPTSLSPGAESLSPVGSPSGSGEAELELQCIDETAKSRDSPTAVEPLSSKDSARDSESIISSGMSSLCNSPPLNSKRMSKYSDRYDAVTLKLLSSRLDESLRDAKSLNSGSGSLCLGRMGSRSVSASLTNGCYSPAASVVSTATIRTTSNPKESKDQQNRKKLLTRPGSEFSLGNQEELEMDYYDYNVINAGAAPGSYLGMDPAYCIWIPPFEETPEREDDDKTPEPAQVPDESTNPLYEEIQMPKYGHYLCPGSKGTTADNTPSSEERSLPSSQQQSKATSPCEPSQKSATTQKTPTKQPTPYMSRKQRRQARQQLKLNAEPESGTLRPNLATKQPTEIAAVHQSLTKMSDSLDSSQSMTGSYVEKETLVEKSSSDLKEYLDLDDIQFADESGSDYETANLKNQAKHGAQRPKSKEAAV
ncbi:hypothetical protein ACLKA7_014839 [Drosophila subpalustris]